MLRLFNHAGRKQHRYWDCYDAHETLLALHTLREYNGDNLGQELKDRGLIDQQNGISISVDFSEPTRFSTKGYAAIYGPWVAEDVIEQAIALCP